MERILCQHLTIGYDKRVVQRDLTFFLQQGEMVCMLGRNGCGKSTLLRTLAGLQPALGGQISGYHPFADTALVLSAADTIERTTVHDVVAMGRYPYTSVLGGLSDADERAIRKAVVWTLGETYSDTPADTCVPVAAPSPLDVFLQSDFAAHSDGEKQRVLIAKALAQETPIILLDEPTAHLDLPNRIRVLQLLRTLAHEQHKTVLISTHELDLALRTSDRILLMTPQAGVQVDTPDHLRATDAFTTAFGMDIFRY